MLQRLSILDSHFTASAPSLVKTTMYDRVALVELNPPTKLIFLTKPLMAELTEEFLRLEKDPQTSVVVLTGKLGNASFATGANINELHESTLKS